MRLCNPNVNLACTVTRQQKRKRLNKLYQCNFVGLISDHVPLKLFKHINALIVPYLRFVVAATCCNHVHVGGKVTANYILRVRFSQTPQQVVWIVILINLLLYFCFPLRLLTGHSLRPSACYFG